MIQIMCLHRMQGWQECVAQEAVMRSWQKIDRQIDTDTQWDRDKERKIYPPSTYPFLVPPAKHHLLKIPNLPKYHYHLETSIETWTYRKHFLSYSKLNTTPLLSKSHEHLKSTYQVLTWIQCCQKVKDLSPYSDSSNW